MTPELARHMAAREKADQVIAAVAEAPDGGLLLRVSVTDVDSGEVLATCFVNYQPNGTRLQIVEDPW